MPDAARPVIRTRAARDTDSAEANQGQRLRLLSYNVQAGISTARYRHYITQSWKHVLP
ncbi:MAG: hypothetical protein WBO57_12180, partial [Gammaproteobacteria bacterium]